MPCCCQGHLPLTHQSSTTFLGTSSKVLANILWKPPQSSNSSLPHLSGRWEDTRSKPNQAKPKTSASKEQEEGQAKKKDKPRAGGRRNKRRKKKQAKKKKPRSKCIEESFPSLIQTGESSSIHLILGCYLWFLKTQSLYLEVVEAGGARFRQK